MLVKMYLETSAHHLEDTPELQQSGSRPYRSPALTTHMEQPRSPRFRAESHKGVPEGLASSLWRARGVWSSTRSPNCAVGSSRLPCGGSPHHIVECRGLRRLPARAHPACTPATHLFPPPTVLPAARTPPPLPWSRALDAARCNCSRPALDDQDVGVARQWPGEL
ncbi:hypothetical protein LDHU3_34.4940:CDS1 [Leishmania donovani]|uniref:Hypothetical_protein n=1 Tax=Leishmania donovani TaxID=5661 RepID=A0A6J8FNK7_LEIDO|nr:hypothetical protein LDHU3_34.4940:CDS1 [Leishmania donovani]VDZ48499.1 hypothetical_protein [Leishmania donovani]